MEKEKLEQVEKIKAEDKKQGKKYIWILVACFLGGGICGFFSAGLKDGNVTNAIAEMLSFAIREGSFYANAVFAVLATVIVTVLYRKSRKMYEAWDGEDEEVIEKIEKNLSIALTVLATYSVAYMIVMVIGFGEVFRFGEGEIEIQIGKLVIFGIGFVASMLIVQIGQQKLVNFTKEINPEKKGSVYDSKFQEKWIESCDEAERQAIYKAAFSSYKSTNMVCIILCMFNLVAMHLWDVGIVPVCMVGIIWLASVIAYSVKAMQIESGKGN